ncbi:MAG: hypothetical protein KKE44_23720 [Proteobacteria bacterium]|nr:hypothetical protein [Pseudomonadota bacterium]MBU1585742.1 hypothetical protein [Pseudomonadota bacterium]
MIDQLMTQKKQYFIVLFIIFAFFSCTTLPTKEFSSYKEAFKNARTAGEQVLLDYSVALKEHQENTAERLSKEKVNRTIERPDTFDPIKSASDKVKMDDIQIRIQAWGVIERYNDVLSRLAEGKSVNEVAAAADGLVTSLSNFPLEEISDAAGEILPYVGILKAILSKAEQERTRQAFISTIKKMGPEIEKRFISFLREDARRFYNIRKGLNDRAYAGIQDQVTDLSQDYLSLAKNYKPDTKLQALTDQINQLRTYLKLKEQLKLNNGALNSYDSIAYIQLTQIKGQVEEKVTEAKLKTNELFAYQDMIVAYVELINKVSSSLVALRVAVENNILTSPSVEDLVPVFIELRKAIQIYQDNKRR